MLRLLPPLLAAVSLLLLAAGPGDAGPAGPLKVALSGDLSSFNPMLGYDDNGATIFHQVYDSFTVPGKNGEPAPNLVTSWREVGARTWILQLRHDARFSDGRLLTSADVLATLDAYRKVGLATVSLPYVTSWKALGRFTVELGLSGPNTIVPEYLEEMFVFPAKQLRAGVDLGKTFVPGTGPYTVVSHVPGVSWQLAANRYWWGGKPASSRLQLLVVPSDTARIAALQSGAAYAAVFASVDSANTVWSRNIVLHVQPTSDYYMLGVDGLKPQNPALKDVRVRRAIMYALDKPSIVKLALGSLGNPTGVYGGGFADGCTAAGDPFAHQNLVKARALLRAAKATNLSLTLLIAPYASTLPAIGQVIQQELGQAGITVKLQTANADSMLDATYTKGWFDLALSYRSGGGDATQPVYDVAPSNLKGVSVWPWIAPDAPLSKAILKLKQRRPGAARTAALRQVCRLAALNVGWEGLATKPEFVAYRSDRIANLRFPDLETAGQALVYLSRARVK
jgi:peptide/nickel transport system substrate-binding protein